MEYFSNVNFNGVLQSYTSTGIAALRTSIPLLLPVLPLVKYACPLCAVSEVTH